MKENKLLYERKRQTHNQYATETISTHTLLNGQRSRYGDVLTAVKFSCEQSVNPLASYSKNVGMKRESAVIIQQMGSYSAYFELSTHRKQK